MGHEKTNVFIPPQPVLFVGGIMDGLRQMVDHPEFGKPIVFPEYPDRSLALTPPTDEEMTTENIRTHTHTYVLVWSGARSKKNNLTQLTCWYAVPQKEMNDWVVYLLKKLWERYEGEQVGVSIGLPAKDEGQCLDGRAHYVPKGCYVCERCGKDVGWGK